MDAGRGGRLSRVTLQRLAQRAGELRDEKRRLGAEVAALRQEKKSQENHRRMREQEIRALDLIAQAKRCANERRSERGTRLASQHATHDRALDDKRAQCQQLEAQLAEKRSALTQAEADVTRVSSERLTVQQEHEAMCDRYNDDLQRALRDLDSAMNERLDDDDAESYAGGDDVGEAGAEPAAEPKPAPGTPAKLPEGA